MGIKIAVNTKSFPAKCNHYHFGFRHFIVRRNSKLISISLRKTQRSTAYQRTQFFKIETWTLHEMSIGLHTHIDLGVKYFLVWE